MNTTCTRGLGWTLVLCTSVLLLAASCSGGGGGDEAQPPGQVESTDWDDLVWDEDVWG